MADHVPDDTDALIGEVLTKLISISETLMHCLVKQARKIKDDPDFPEANMWIAPDMTVAQARAEVERIKAAMQ